MTDAGVIEDEALWTRLPGAEAIGRPAGGEGWIADLEARLGMTLRPRRRGRKPRAADDIDQGGLFG